MPSSRPDMLSQIILWIREINPKSVLDIGVGFGTMGALVREHTDIRHGRYWKKQWKVIIHGIEIYEKYKNPIWDFAYNKVIIGDAYKVIDNVDNYDLFWWF